MRTLKVLATVLSMALLSAPLAAFATTQAGPDSDAAPQTVYAQAEAGSSAPNDGSTRIASAAYATKVQLAQTTLGQRASYLLQNG
ncbi:hypothetical protein [Burkholderia sp. L27(2015)]|uniref:hypothetical protein n=1 Tax=Burkholderia sp. L27(2015) TaxID=1641858 RepID=UPI00131AB745|nr:hypothetical protein [Burkholderia sp. L27(2015)]